MEGNKASDSAASPRIRRSPRDRSSLQLPNLVRHRGNRKVRFCLVHFPETVIFEILARLPVKSLLRFRSVCKSWLAMISEQKFVKTHLKYALESCQTLRRHIVFKKNYISNSVNTICVDYETHEKELLTDSPFENCLEIPEILGSCNGLLLVGLGPKSHILWNPLTRKHVFDFTIKFHFHDYQRLYGLCYDFSTDAYKVVRVTRGTSIEVRPATYDSTRASFYNSKAKSWTLVEHFPYKLFNSARGVLVNGNLHFVVVRDIHHMNRHPHVTVPVGTNNTSRDYVIVYFDAVEDKFKELPKPDWLNQECSFNMGTLGGLLCLVQHNYEMSNLSMMWVMQQYGVGDSWTPMRTIRIKSNKQLPLYLKKNGEIMLEIKNRYGTSHELVAYSRPNVRDTAREVIQYGNQTGFKSTPYVESLISPFEAI